MSCPSRFAKNPSREPRKAGPDGAARGTRTPTVARWYLKPVRLPIPPLAHEFIIQHTEILSTASLVDFPRIELGTYRLRGGCSNQLS